MKLSSDLCAGVSLIGILIAVPSALITIIIAVMMVGGNPWAKYYGPLFTFFGAIPAVLLGALIFVFFFRESKRMKQVEAEEELIRKLALERLEKDKLRSN